MAFGVVGHTEWVDFAVSSRLPRPGEILQGREAFSVAGGGGAVAAVQLGLLAGARSFFLTALGGDDAGRWARADLERRALELHAVEREESQRRAFTFLTDDHERTITVLGERLVPERARDALPWERCDGADAVYFTGGDAAALQASRGARVLVATPRAREAIATAGVQLDVLVASGSDRGEQVTPAELDPPPRAVVLTDGGKGGRWVRQDGEEGTWPAAELPGPAVDAYGCGDSFAAGLTFGLGSGLALPAALALAARCDAHCLTGRGPYAAQLRLT